MSCLKCVIVNPTYDKIWYIMKEKCVSCGHETDFNTTTDVNYRFYYIEGGGQLCKKCYDRIFEDTNDEFDDYID